MPLLNQPWMVQVNWTGAVWAGTASSPWEQANANLLCDGTLISLDIQRAVTRSRLGTDRCVITAYDAQGYVAPGKLSSPLYPNVALGRPVRVLAQDSASTAVWHAQFYGFISAINPSLVRPYSVEVTVDSPLQYRANERVAVGSVIDGVVYRASGGTADSALTALLGGAGLWGSGFVDLDDVGNTPLGPTWGGGTVTLGGALGDLCELSGCFAWVEPQYGTAAGDPDWTLRWAYPTAVDPVLVHWSMPGGDLAHTPRITYSGENP